MVEQSPLRVDVSELIRRPAATKELVFDAEVPDLAQQLGRVEGPVHGELRFEAILEGVLAAGRLTGEYRLECVRCAAEFARPFDVEATEVFVYAEMPEVEEGFRVDDDLIDLAPMIRDALLLDLPVNPLHDEACKGLCSTCGQDLNVADCGHSHEHVDIRWEPLRRLQEKTGE